MGIRRLGLWDRRKLRSYLAQKPDEYLSLLGLANETSRWFGTGGFFTAADVSDWHLSPGVCYLGGDGLTMVASVNEEDAARLGRLARGSGIPIRAIMGARTKVERFWDALWDGSPPDWEKRWLVRDHQLYSLRPEGLVDGPYGLVRPAHSGDLDTAVELCRAMALEELGQDVYSRNPGGFRLRVWWRVVKGVVFLAEVDGVPVFKVEVGVQCPFGAHLEGVYTVPGYRRRGVASAALRAICGHLLEALPRVTLQVWDENIGAVKLYQALGFEPVHPFRVILPVPPLT